MPACDAEDVAQDALAALSECVRNRCQTDPEVPQEALLFCIIRRRVCDYWRSERSKLFDELNEASSVVGSHDVGFAIRESISFLDPQHELVLLLSLVGGYTTSEIAHKLGRSAGRVGAMLASAKHSVRQVYAESPKGREGRQVIPRAQRAVRTLDECSALQEWLGSDTGEVCFVERSNGRTRGSAVSRAAGHFVRRSARVSAQP